MKEILALNLRLSPLMVKIQTYNEFKENCCSQESQSPDQRSKVDKMVKLLQFFINGTFYRSKRVY